MNEHPNAAGLAYAALRRGGAPAWRATTELGLCDNRGRAREAIFQASRSRGEMQPRFAEDHRHVAAVLAAGGYPAIST